MHGLDRMSKDLHYWHGPISTGWDERLFSEAHSSLWGTGIPKCPVLWVSEKRTFPLQGGSFVKGLPENSCFAPSEVVLEFPFLVSDIGRLSVWQAPRPGFQHPLCFPLSNGPDWMGAWIHSVTSRRKNMALDDCNSVLVWGSAVHLHSSLFFFNQLYWGLIYLHVFWHFPFPPFFS